MAKKRFYESGARVSHARDQFNDEIKNDRDGMRMDPRKPLGEEFYAGGGARRRMELEDGGMIHEDHSAIANLPQNVMMKPYPKTGPYMPEDLDDRIEGVDRQMDFDDSQRRKHFFPKKV
jgi:hypothetical protein